MIIGFDLTFEKWFLSFPNKNNCTTDHKFCTPLLVDKVNFTLEDFYKKELY